jgi:UDP-2,3-diacylglucosamine pyrophosphatase LpxH
MMASHDDLLRPLLAAFPKQVHLVACYASKDLKFEDDELRVFLPDFHWMSAACLRRYTGGYQFNGNAKANGVPMFAGVLDVLEGIKSGNPALEIYQLGDRFDLWREMTGDDPDVVTAYMRVRNDSRVSGLATRLDQLGTEYIRGNHDAWLAEVEKTISAPKSSPELHVAGDNIFMTHGHIYDNIERILPDTVKAVLVGLCPTVKPGRYDVGPFSAETLKSLNGFLALRKRAKYPPDLWPTVVPDGARLLTAVGDVAAMAKSVTQFLDVTGFLHGNTTSRDDFEHASYLTFGDRIYEFEQQHPSDHRVYVIGHTHHARILVDKLPSGRPLVLMDCGGWIETCTIYDEPSDTVHAAPSAQLGAQCGNELRIYQLGGNLRA